MRTKQLLIVTALLESVAGLALACCPSETVVLLLGSPLETSAALTLGRIAGAALIALGMANWLAHYDHRSRAAMGLVAAMLLYNLAVVVILAAAGIATSPTGIGLWPGVAVHVAMSVWCAVTLLLSRLPRPPGPAIV